jgi:hypothetical protein
VTSVFQQKPPVAGGPETKPGADSLGRDPFPDVDHLRQLMRHVFSRPWLAAFGLVAEFAQFRKTLDEHLLRKVPRRSPVAREAQGEGIHSVFVSLEQETKRLLVATSRGF